MPRLGEVRRAMDVGLASGSHKVVWAACLDCAKERWVLYRSGEPQSKRCHPCGAKAGAEKRRGVLMGPRASNWRGGRHATKAGYIRVTLAPDDPYSAMSDKHRHRSVYEHRYVMAKHLGRCLTSEEEVHHLNGDKADNRIENLELTTRAQHAADHRREVLTLRAKVQELERELRKAKAETT